MKNDGSLYSHRENSMYKSLEGSSVLGDITNTRRKELQSQDDCSIKQMSSNSYCDNSSNLSIRKADSYHNEFTSDSENENITPRVITKNMY